MYRNIGISIGYPQLRVGEECALEMAAAADADGVDFDTSGSRFDDRRSESVYALPDEALVSWAYGLCEHYGE